MALSEHAAARKDREVKPARFQHAHFTVIADILRRLPDNIDGDPAVLKAVTHYFANELRGTNPEFNTTRFLAACGE